MSKNQLLSTSFLEQYHSVLKQYFETGDEEHLLEALRVGRNLANTPYGLLEISNMHHTALTDTLAGIEFQGMQRYLELANTFFMSLMSGVEMMTGGYHQLAKEILNQKKQQHVLEELNEELEQFNFLVSHDLKEPVRTITLFCELLPEYMAAGDKEKIDNALGHIRSSCTRIQTLMEDLLGYACLKEKVSFEKVAMETCVKTAIQTLGELLADVIIDIKTPLYTIDGNKSLLVHLWLNLIGNAVKYNKSVQKKIIIEAREEKDAIHYTIADNGIGIKEKYLELIFKPFKRLHNTSVYQGTGIGLALCQKVVQKHGGTISATSQEGKGAIFHFYIPKEGASHG